MSDDKKKGANIKQYNFQCSLFECGAYGCLGKIWQMQGNKSQSGATSKEKGV